ncbi:Serine/threonine-protein phosphatase PP-Y [Tritrichomonas foetus]|uniref:Serine/threonine-protein phosphatase n=1 Tax=Tritrichomonas foetus TaxID=1144522 RepID=A0A1J4K1I5_9EUKA|nr:Serine/threonine-protein phosphatase PP-Y [Tritrichomonas foetus]|eukprot:OHT05099.1 Serine/threonine-protein phosphatase PP-Y [Tritrichomonas foetus]
MQEKSFYKNILDDFLQYTKYDIDLLACGKEKMTLNLLEERDLLMILSDVLKIFKNETVQLNIQSPCIVIGDLHGHLLDLIRVLKYNGLPTNDGAQPQKKFVFLGDIVDRGEFSLETCLIVFLLKILYPTQVFIIRGNHEFRSMCCQFGFHQELYRLYSRVVYEEFLNVFSFMPISIVIDSTILCVHGGIGPGMNSISQLSSIQRPITEFDSSAIASAVLWSDPSDSVHSFKDSPRGTGFLFGKEVTSSFLRNVKKTVIIRGHECSQSGVETRFNGSVITVFTASNYCGVANNKAGVLIIQPGSKFETKRYNPLQYLKRKDVNFKQFDSPIPKLTQSISLAKYTCTQISLAKGKNAKLAENCKLTPDTQMLKMNIVKALKFRRASYQAPSIEKQ